MKIKAICDLIAKCIIVGIALSLEGTIILTVGREILPLWAAIPLTVAMMYATARLAHEIKRGYDG